MGTRALVDLADESGVFTTIYRHNDGYPDGLGMELRDVLGGTTIINGIRGGQELPLFANGMGCAAAYLISQLKTEIGRVEVRPAGQRDVWEEYVYVLTGSVESGRIQCLCHHAAGEVVYDGPLSAFHDIRVSEDKGVEEGSPL